MLCRSERLSNGALVIAGKSTTHPLVPANPDFVRADVRFSGWLIEPRGPKCCVVSYMLDTDFNSALPAWFLQMVTRKQPLIIDKIRQILVEPQLQVKKS